MILRLLNPQGIAGIVAGTCLALLLIVQKVETHRWKSQSSTCEQRLATEQSKLAETVAGYRAAADLARAADRANAERVAAEQRSINERTEHDFQARLAAARTAAASLYARRLREAGPAAADTGGRGGTKLSGIPAAAGRPDQAAREDGLPDALIATEQAIQLDELIKWVQAQAKVDANSPSPR